VQAELRREKETWSIVQQNHGGEPFTDDITANPRTRMNSFQARILPSFAREKPTSPESSSTTEDRSSNIPDNTRLDVTDNTTRAEGYVDFVGAATTEEGIIGAGGLERSASRSHSHDHTTTSTITNNNGDLNRDLEKQEDSTEIIDGV
jgi:hypothetical protein